MTTNTKLNLLTCYLLRSLLILASVCYLIVCVPGKLVPPTLMEVPLGFAWRTKEVIEFEHGWPMPVLRRAFMQDFSKRSIYTDPIVKVGKLRRRTGERTIPITWSMPAAWSLSADVRQWHWGAFVVNIVAGCLFLLLIRHYWKARANVNLKNFGLKSVFALMLIFSIAIGWYMHHWREYHREQKILDRLPASTDDRFFRFTDYRKESYRGPDWLVRLLGSPKLLPICHRAYRLQIDVEEMSEQQWDEITSLRYVGEIGGKGFSKLQANDRLLAHISRWKYLGELTMVPSDDDLNGNPTGITERGIRHLTKLPRLTSITLYGAALTHGRVEAIGQIPQLRSVHFINCRILGSDEYIHEDEIVKRLRKLLPAGVTVSW